jgi:arginyl-tRNA synthetase
LVTPEQLSAAVVDALTSLQSAGVLPGEVTIPQNIRVERPRSREHGDYATTVALQLARQAGIPPRELASALAKELLQREGVASVDVAGPGFVNITVDSASQGDVAAQIVQAGAYYGRSDGLAGITINVEFVSANPTGPITLASARWAAVGDALSRMLEAGGAAVTREYYFNDHGAQIDRFAESLLARARGQEVPEDGYSGSYLDEIAKRVVEAHSELAELDDAAAQEVFRHDGTALMFDEIKQALAAFGVHFDVFFHENTLHENHAVERAISKLTELGMTYERDGALWLRTTKYGDDKDRVIVRSSGVPAYLSGDLAYYLDKRERGFERCIILVGADHHGYVGRLMAMCASFGDTPGENLEVIVGQIVRLVRNGEPVRMGKRSGNIVTLDDLVDAIGNDGGRYALVRYSTDAGIDIDLDLWARQSSDNPVYYVQYAHARLSSILRNGEAIGLMPDANTAQTDLLDHEREGELLRALAEYPRVVTQATQLREPHRIARYLEDTASAFHKFYDECRVLPTSDEEPSAIHRARLLLIDATRVVVHNGLDLLGVSAPERM